jgi:hypothetical protein
MVVPESDAVFVDRTGRRRRMVVGAGVALGGGLLVAIALLIAGLTGAASLPLPGLPEGDHRPMRGQAGPVGPASVTSPRGPGRTPSTDPSLRPASPSVTAPATGTSSTLSPTVSTQSTLTGPPGLRRTAHPGNPKPSRTK